MIPLSQGSCKGQMKQSRCDRLKIKMVYLLNPETYETVHLHGQRDFANVLKLRTLRLKDYPGFCMWAQSNQRVLISVRQENQNQKRRGEDGVRRGEARVRERGKTEKVL